jgi:hypothetical protein
MIMEKACKNCNVVLTNENAAKKNAKYFRNICKPCNSKRACQYQKDNPEKRKAYANSYARAVGRVREYPCEHCGKMCYKKYALAFCSDRCRFLSSVLMSENVNECWVWMGGVNARGYGKASMDGKFIPAHRMSYILFFGEIPDGKLVCHACDNPPCVKPAHLWIGTTQENTKDMVKKRRHIFGEKSSVSKLSSQDVRDILALERLGINQAVIGEKFNISAGHVNNIVKKRVWKHIEE